jgi:hypothetical protein
MKTSEPALLHPASQSAENGGSLDTILAQQYWSGFIAGVVTTCLIAMLVQLIRSAVRFISKPVLKQLWLQGLLYAHVTFVSTLAFKPTTTPQKALIEHTGRGYGVLVRLLKCLSMCWAGKRNQPSRTGPCAFALDLLKRIARPRGPHGRRKVSRLFM